MSFIRNKIDLVHESAGLKDTPVGPEISLSAKSGEGMALLRQHLKECMGYASPESGEFLARRRHIEALRASAYLH